MLSSNANNFDSLSNTYSPTIFFHEARVLPLRCGSRQSSARWAINSNSTSSSRDRALVAEFLRGFIAVFFLHQSVEVTEAYICRKRSLLMRMACICEEKLEVQIGMGTIIYREMKYWSMRCPTFVSHRDCQNVIASKMKFWAYFWYFFQRVFGAHAPPPPLGRAVVGGAHAHVVDAERADARRAVAAAGRRPARRDIHTAVVLPAGSVPKPGPVTDHTWQPRRQGAMHT